eukprot:9073549-Pyramimonas_sp.AAC.1
MGPYTLKDAAGDTVTGGPRPTFCHSGPGKQRVTCVTPEASTHAGATERGGPRLELDLNATTVHACRASVLRTAWPKERGGGSCEQLDLNAPTLACG